LRGREAPNHALACLCIYLCTYLFIVLFIYLFIYLFYISYFIYLFVYLFVYVGSVLVNVVPPQKCCAVVPPLVPPLVPQTKSEEIKGNQRKSMDMPGHQGNQRKYSGTDKA